MTLCIWCREPTDRTEMVNLCSKGKHITSRKRQPMCQGCYERHVRDTKQKKTTRPSPLIGRVKYHGGNNANGEI